MTAVKLICPTGQGREVPALAEAIPAHGRRGDKGYTPPGWVPHGAVVDVPDDLAGRAPTDDDLGEGLLAQYQVWTAAGDGATHRGRKGRTETNDQEGDS